MQARSETGVIAIVGTYNLDFVDADCRLAYLTTQKNIDHKSPRLRLYM